MPRSKARHKGPEPSPAAKGAVVNAAKALNKKLKEFSDELERAKEGASPEERLSLDLRIFHVRSMAGQIESNCIHPNFGFTFLRLPCSLRPK